MVYIVTRAFKKKITLHIRSTHLLRGDESKRDVPTGFIFIDYHENCLKNQSDVRLYMSSRVYKM